MPSLTPQNSNLINLAEAAPLQGGLSALAEFGLAAVAVGCTIIPTKADDAKTPSVANWTRSRRQRRSTIARWTEAFPGANYGIVTERSGLVVVDCDDAEALARCEEEFGASPVLVASGRAGGGWHSYYSWPAEVDAIASVDLRRLDIAAEIKAQGTFVVGPGSIHPKTKVRYEFVRGSWEMFTSLPVFPVVALDNLMSTTRSERTAPSLNPVGRRNNSLFLHLCHLAASGLFAHEEDAIQAAEEYNKYQNVVPEPEAKVAQTARSVWKYFEQGSLRKPARLATSISGEQYVKLRSLGKDFSNALALYTVLRFHHRGTRLTTFAIAASSMASTEVVSGWTDRKRYLKATAALIRCGLLVQVSRSWAERSETRSGTEYGSRHPALYRFGVEGE